LRLPFLSFVTPNGVFVWYAVFKSFEGRGRFDVGGIVKVFNRYRNAMQLTAPPSCLDLCLTSCSLCTRFVSQDSNECVKRWVKLFDSLETACQNLHG